MPHEGTGDTGRWELQSRFPFCKYREKETIGIDMETDECIGICETDDKGHIIEIER